MRIQKQFVAKRGEKVYHKYVVVLPEKIVKESQLKEGEELEAEAKKGEIKLRRRKP